ncbi:MAG TPA: extensin family protein [Polyangiaceae bacterium]|nr:extensin family protein [Polyangiaceae bacterium]
MIEPVLAWACPIAVRRAQASLGLLLSLVSCGDPPGPPVARAPVSATSAPVAPAAAPPEVARAPEGAAAAASTAAAPSAAAQSGVAPAAPVVPDYEQADLDADNDLLVAPPVPIDDCPKRLERAQIAFAPTQLPLKREKTVGPSGRAEVVACGAEQVVVYLGGPAKIKYNAAPTLTCRMALALGRFEELAQEQALKHLGQRIARFKHLGTYSCRKMVRFDFVSEHSYANAIDIEEITLENGARLSVKKNFGALDAAPSTRQSQFLRSLARRAFDERLFSTVLTPFWDKLHHDHFHLDLARYRVDGTRPN